MKLLIIDSDYLIINLHHGSVLLLNSATNYKGLWNLFFTMPGRCWYPLAWNVPYWCCSFRQSIIRHAIATLARSDPVFPFAAVLSSLYDHRGLHTAILLVVYKKKRFPFLDNIANTPFQKEAGRRWTWRSLSGNTKHEINITIDTTSMVIVVTVINRVNIGSDHSMLLGSVTLA